MPITVFFSWQVDTATREGRNFIDRALERAIANVSSDVELEEVARDGLEIDRDTKGVPGSPPIVDTIFRKIDQTAVFVPDLTFVGNRLDGRPTPNPNVMVEYGWALKSLGHGRIVPVMNVAHGEPTSEAMPFDLRHLRNPILYHVPKDATEKDRKIEREKLVKALENAVRTVLSSDEFKASLPSEPKLPIFKAREPKDGQGRFRANQPIGYAYDQFRGAGGSAEVHLTKGAAMWLRLMPQHDPGRTWAITDLERVATQNNKMLLPLGSEGFMGFNYMRHEDGFGLYAVESSSTSEVQSIVFAFERGEVWGIDTYLMEATKNEAIPFIEGRFTVAFDRFANFLSRLGIKPPYRWIAGMEGLKGRPLKYPPPLGSIVPPGGVGSCIPDIVVADGLHQSGETAVQSLKPFFVRLFDKCGIPRPDYLDTVRSGRR